MLFLLPVTLLATHTTAQASPVFEHPYRDSDVPVPSPSGVETRIHAYRCQNPETNQPVNVGALYEVSRAGTKYLGVIQYDYLFAWTYWIRQPKPAYLANCERNLRKKLGLPAEPLVPAEDLSAPPEAESTL